MLGTAHPSSFSSWSVNNYIAYAFVGGKGTMLGIVVGSALLIVMTNLFSAFAHLSAGLFGILLIDCHDGWRPTGSSAASISAHGSTSGRASHREPSRRRRSGRRRHLSPVQSLRALRPPRRASAACACSKISRSRYRHGGIMGVIGPNGAGKTTLINVICGMFPPTSGRILLGDPGHHGQAVARRQRARRRAQLPANEYVRDRERGGEPLPRASLRTQPQRRQSRHRGSAR